MEVIPAGLKNKTQRKTSTWWFISILVTQLIATLIMVYGMVEVFCAVDELYEETYKFNVYHESLMKQAYEALKEKKDTVDSNLLPGDNNAQAPISSD